MTGLKHDNPVEQASTRSLILQAAIRILWRDGYQKMTARAIAAEAGTNLALVNYYYGSKRNLLLEIFDELDRRKIERQRDMYLAASAPLSVKWRQAVAFYRQDLADGYVRILQELTALGYADTDIADRVRARRAEWHALIREVAQGHVSDLGINAPPDFVADAVVAFWLGMETEHLIGVIEDDVPFFKMLDVAGDWLAERKQQQTGAHEKVVTGNPD